MLFGLSGESRIAGFLKRIPSLAMRALAQPFWADATAFRTRKDRFYFGHESLWRTMHRISLV
jgi:hypothetical protein